MATLSTGPSYISLLSASMAARGSPGNNGSVMSDAVSFCKKLRREFIKKSLGGLLFKKWDTGYGIFFHGGFIYFHANARLFGERDKAVFYPIAIVGDDLFKHRV